MTHSRRSQSNRTRYGSRRNGIAPLELALALPILMVMLSMIFGVCNVTETRMMTTIAARNDAYAKRHQPWLHAQESIDLREVGKVDRMLGPNPVMPARGGLVTGSATGVATKMFGPLSDFVWQAESKRVVLGGGWDYQEIDFAKHSKLSLPKQATFFGMPASSVDGFSGIGNLAGAFVGSFGQVNEQVQQALQDARKAVTERLLEIQRELKQLSSQLGQQKQELANLQRSPALHASAIQTLKKQIKQTQERIDELKHEQSQQQGAGGGMGVDLTLSPIGSNYTIDSKPNKSGTNQSTKQPTSLTESWDNLSQAEKEIAKDALSLWLDIVGIFDPTPAVDAAAFALAVQRGNYLDALVSGVGTVPYLGDAAKIAKLPKYVQTIAKVRKVLKGSTRAEKFFRVLLKNGMTDGDVFSLMRDSQ